ncbi:RNA polymerase II transcriptional coactivator KELP-like [Rosa rugosa]|uniref:RNA polymerase II transcriptional coactivator KELP-like n=1 Tax=Rosa rugosa TaxID=74645 RepID=UPI002B40AB69|nr:RNA polymerase II transcriptional coactivator KELP-like [Rosa rugosa]
MVVGGDFRMMVLKSNKLLSNPERIGHGPSDRVQDSEAADEEESKAAEESNQEREYDENGGLVICRLSHKRKVTVQVFKGKPLVSLKEFFTKEGKELPTSKVTILCMDISRSWMKRLKGELHLWK